MKIQLWRNATTLLEINGKRILVDPMLGAKGSMGLLPMLKEQLPNPLVDLPFSKQELEDQLQNVDAVLLTHLHPDHWDAEAQRVLSKELPVVCSPELVPELNKQGFTNTLAVNKTLKWEGVQFDITEARHGTGEIGAMMGTVHGFVLQTSAESLYLAGDTIWYDAIASVLHKFKPAHIVLNGGAARFDRGGPILMTSEDLIQAAKVLTSSSYYIVHLEALSHSREGRARISSDLAEHGLKKRCFVLADGEVVDTDVN
ncbi:MBL fold metallo-hydrolase [Desertivirga arenae]|uniref:MBL fold metallo-hydrolase n=1 Tax=Desertivirga arenae TaxID=2810309 RepID=UPI001A9607E2|nr:MBL fold metallo-hydrolase [Pedobacter sp. SYSU D00823]